MKNTKYNDYDITVQKWMNSLEKDLINEIGEIPKSYQVQLDLIADAFETYVEAKKILKSKGLLIKDSRGGDVKNPVVSILNSSQLFITKLLNQFILTRSAKSKLKNIEIDEDSPIDEFI